MNLSLFKKIHFFINIYQEQNTLKRFRLLRSFLEFLELFISIYFVLKYYNVILFFIIEKNMF